MHILIAPNAFKNSLAAAEVAVAIEQGLKLSRLDCTTECFSIADGGDGTGSLIVANREGQPIWEEVCNPLGKKIISSFGLIDQGKTAVIEMADASGLRLLKKDELDPLRSSSYGTGELIKYALDRGVNRIIIAMGGSATVDGGCGILSALGVLFLDEEGDRLIVTPRELASMARIDASGLDKRVFDCDIVILCDVDNMLLGPEGAASIFGPQKGATNEDVVLLEEFLKRFAEVSFAQSGKNMADIKHGGVAGGATAGLHTWLNAKLVNGIDYFLTLTNFEESLGRSDLLITGEGSIDRQTLQGKGPYGVALRAKHKGISVIGLAGKIPTEPDVELQEYFDAMVSINSEAVDIYSAMENTKENLVRTARMVGNLLALGK